MNITNEFLENGYIIHNDHQISIEVDYEVRLYTVENTYEFIEKLKND